MKISFAKKIATAILVAANLLCIDSANAQPCLKTNTLIINTGIDANNVQVPYTSSGVADPFWTITAQTGPVPTGVVLGSPATIATNTVMASDPNSNLISYSATGGSTGYVTTPNNTSFGFFSLTFTRTFTTCVDDQFHFYMDLAFDNYLVDIRIDGVAIPGATTSPTTSAPGFYQWGNIYTSAQSLLAGAHTISVTIGNEYATYLNPTSLNIRGSITGTTNSLVANNSGPNCECNTACNDSCYWKVNGNNIIGGNNIFGTLTNDDIQIQTSGTDRGIITNKGLLGWNTMTPTAWLHVNCNNNNEGQFSDIRFENLEPWDDGNVLIIRKDGYVFDSKVPIGSLSKMVAAQQKEIEALKLLVLQQSERLNSEGLSSEGGYLAQNVPNPFSASTLIKYELPSGTGKAAIGIYDMNGKEVKLFQLSSEKSGTVTINGGELTPGMYLYSLIVDGKYFSSKKMILTSK